MTAPGLLPEGNIWLKDTALLVTIVFSRIICLVAPAVSFESSTLGYATGRAAALSLLQRISRGGTAVVLQTVL